MLTLLLLRHAKAEPGGRGDDHARRLADRGEQEAGEVGRFLAVHGLRPDYALVSTAERTTRTFERVARCFDVPVPFASDASLYDATSAGIVGRIGQVAGASCLMVVGHNPGIMEAAIALAAGGDFAEVERLRGRFPPGALAVLGFEHETWADACAAGGQLDALVFPADLAG